RPRPAPTPPMPGLVEQINGVLQRQLAATPALAGREVHMESDPAGGLRITVDGRSYARPSEIPDEHIQDVIKAALHTWENS
ncbi:MAG: hypothetical protein ACRDHL_07500, partial [Candidatus Promineifilaceae bacterium]